MRYLTDTITSDEGVSPVVAVVLMVAIAVILGGVALVGVSMLTSQPDHVSVGVSKEYKSATVSSIQIVDTGSSEKAVVVSPLGTEYTMQNVGESTEVLSIRNEGEAKVLAVKGSKRVVSNSYELDGFSVDITVDKHGTEDYSSIQNAVDNASVGDTIAIEKATYTENVDVDKDVTLIAEHGTVVKDANPERAVFDIIGNGVTVSNFVINANPVPNDGHYSRHGIYVGGNNVSLVGNKILKANSDSVSAGITVSGKNVEVLSNVIESSTAGIRVTDHASTHVIRRNDVSVGGSKEIVNTGVTTLDASRNVWSDSSSPGAKGLVETSPPLDSFGGRVAAIDTTVVRGAAGTFERVGVIKTEGERTYIQNGRTTTNWFSTRIKVFISSDAQPIILVPTGPHSVTVKSTPPTVDASNVVESVSVGRTTRSIDGQATSDSETVLSEDTTLNAGESFSIDFNESSVPMSSSSIHVTGVPTRSSTDSSGSNSPERVTVTKHTVNTSGGVSQTTQRSTETADEFTVNAGNDITLSEGDTATFIAEVVNISSSEVSSYDWKIAGNVRSGKQVSHTFNNTGTYQATVTVTSTTSGTSSDSIEITVESGDTQSPPVARISAPSTVEANTSVTFDGGDTYDPDGSISKYEWDFDGDGTVDATGKSVSHAFTSPGTRTVALAVTDDSGLSRSTTTDIQVNTSNSAPNASFTVSPSYPASGETITFDGSGSSDPDGDSLSYEWDFTNDGVVDATGKSVTHSYASVGTYTVSLVVSDSDTTSNVTKTVDVQNSFTKYRKLYYKLEDASTPSTAIDAEGNHNGQINGPTYVDDSVRGTVLEFSGDTDAIDTGMKEQSVPVTFSAWVKVTNTSKAGVLVSNRPSGSGSGDDVYFNYNSDGNNRFQLYVDGCGKYCGIVMSDPVTDNGWHHVVGVVGTSETRMYVDGSRVDSLNEGQSTTLNTGVNFTIGRRPQNTGEFPGRIDSVSIYNTALNDSQVSQLYADTSYSLNWDAATQSTNVVHESVPHTDNNQAQQLKLGYSAKQANLKQSLVGYFPLDTGASTAYDVDEGNHGSVSGTSLSPGILNGNARNFDGDGSDAIDIPYKGAYPSGNEDWTMMAWFNPDTWGSSDTIFGIGDGDVHGYADVRLYSNPTRLVAWLDDPGETVGAEVKKRTDTWQHVALSRESNTYKLWINGTLVDTYTTSDGQNAGTLKIGRPSHGGYSNYYFNGNISDFKIYNEALNSTEMKSAVDNVKQGSITVTKTYSHERAPDIGGLEYNLHNQSITVRVTGSPGEADKETKTVTLTGNSNQELSWASTHSTFKVTVTLNTTNPRQTPTLSQLALVPDEDV